MLAAVTLLAIITAAAIVHSLAAVGAITQHHLVSAAALIVALASVQFGQSGTIYDSPPAHPIVYKVGSSDLQEQLGAGFQAAHVWVNNKSNQYLYLPDAPDVVEPGVTRVVATIHTDVGHASWTVPAQYAVTQPNNPAGAAILIFLNAGIDISPTPGLTTSPTVSSPQRNLGQIVLAANANASKGFKVDTGTHAIGILVASGSLKQLQITGGNTGAPYLVLPPPGVTAASFQGPFMSAFFSAVDASVNVFAVAGSPGATVDVVAILNPQAQFVFDNVSQPTAVSVVGGAGTALGDVSAPTLVKDSLSETISFIGPQPFITVVAQAIASFKPAAGQSIAPVGAAGPMTKGTSTAVNPTFGQATVAGHLLVAVVGSAGNPTNTGAAGWTKGPEITADGTIAIWYKPNCGAAEAAPQFTGGPAGFGCMFAQLAEFSGALTAAPLDQSGTSGNFNGNGIAFTSQVSAGGVDASTGDLIVAGTRWGADVNNGAGTPSYSDTLNNNATAIALGNNNGNSDVSSCTGVQNTSIYQEHIYAIVPAIAAALPLGIAPWPYDAMGTSEPATGSNASVVLAATPGKTYIAHALQVDVDASTAAAQQPRGQLLDGATSIWTSLTTVPATVGTSVGRGGAGYAYPGTKGNSMTLRTTSIAAGGIASAALGAYLR
jgi:hypothetical protein